MNNIQNWNNWQSQKDLSEGYCRIVPLTGGIDTRLSLRVQALLDLQRKNAGRKTRIRGLGGVLTPVFRYNPFTAADEKIPLSMVHVNTKPQYLVFSLCLPYPDSKYTGFACGELAEAAPPADFRVPNATKARQTQGSGLWISGRDS